MEEEDAFPVKKAGSEIPLEDDCSGPCLSRCPHSDAMWLAMRQICSSCGKRPCNGGAPLELRVRTKLNRTIIGNGDVIKMAAVWNYDYACWETVSHASIGITRCELARFMEIMGKLENKDQDIPPRDKCQLTIRGEHLICMAACNHGQMYNIPILVLKPVTKPPLWDDEEKQEPDQAIYEDIGGIVVTKTCNFLIFAFHGKLGNPGDAIHSISELTVRLRDYMM